MRNLLILLGLRGFNLFWDGYSWTAVPREAVNYHQARVDLDVVIKRAEGLANQFDGEVMVIRDFGTEAERLMWTSEGGRQ